MDALVGYAIMATEEDKKARGISPEQLAEARRCYEGGEPTATLCRRMKLNRTTLIKAREASALKGDPWIIQPSVQMSTQDVTAIKAAATNKVIDMATRKAVEKAEENGTIDALAMTLNDLLTAQPRIAAKAQLLTEQSLDKASNSIKSATYFGPSEKSDWGQFVAGLLTSAERSTSMVREIAGLKAGQPSEPRDKAKSLQRRFIVQTPEEVAAKTEEVKEAS